MSLSTARISAIRSLSRESFEDFCKKFWDCIPGVPPLIWNWHLSTFCTELQTVAERVFANKAKEYDLVCNVSPGSSKSSIWSILFNCWVLTRMANARFIVASNTESLVLDLAHKTKGVLEHELYRQCFPEVEIQQDRSAKGDFATTAGGERKSCTVGGQSPIGRHAHFIIIDDPIDPSKALSEVELKQAQTFMEKVITKRKVRTDVDIAVTCLVMQRLHDDDPTGLWLKKARAGQMRVRHICLPAELITSEKAAGHVHPPELLKLYKDGLMDPVRLPMRVLDEERHTDLYSYAGQFLQNPTPLEGGMFKESYFNLRKKAAPYESKRVRYWDRAASEGRGCQTAGVLMALDKDGNFYVEDVVVGQWEPTERNEVMLATALKDRSRYGPKHEPTIYVEAEGGSSGRDAWKDIARKLAGFTVREDRVTGNKIARAEPWSSALAAGIVWLIDNGERDGSGVATWDINGYVHEHCHFPFSGLKDRVDSSDGAFNVLKGKKVSSGPVLQSIVIGKRKDNRVRVVVCSRHELPTLESELPAIIVHALDPDAPRIPLDHQLTVMATCYTDFADVQPVECQEAWQEILAPYGKLPQDVVMAEHHGKAVWNFLFRKYPANPGLIVFVHEEEGDRRALSLALAVCDCLRIPFSSVQHLGSDDEPKQAPNQHAFALMKHCRTLVAP